MRPDKDFYWAWFECLIRTDYFQQILERQTLEYHGEKELSPISEEMQEFFSGYKPWTGNNWYFEWTFDKFWTRWTRYY